MIKQMRHICYNPMVRLEGNKAGTLVRLEHGHFIKGDVARYLRAK